MATGHKDRHTIRNEIEEKIEKTFPIFFFHALAIFAEWIENIMLRGKKQK